MFKIYEAEDILPGFSRSSSERSSSSTGASVMSKSLHAAPSRLEGVNSMWQDLNDYLDLNSDTSLWDLDGGSQKMSDLVIGKKLHAPEQLTMTDTINPYAPLFNSQAHNASLQLNSTIASETSGSSNPRFKTEICRNFKEKGTCLYGDLCQFAHGKNELRVSIADLSRKTSLYLNLPFNFRRMLCDTTSTRPSTARSIGLTATAPTDLAAISSTRSRRHRGPPT